MKHLLEILTFWFQTFFILIILFTPFLAFLYATHEIVHLLGIY